MRLISVAFVVMLWVAMGIIVPVSNTQANTNESANYAHPEWLVKPSWIQKHANDPNVKIVALMSADDFERRHIAGSVQIDWPMLRLVESGEAFVSQWQTDIETSLTMLGLTVDDTIIIYDDGTLFSTRLWWVLDYLGHKDKRILNGGLSAWTNADGAIETGPSQVIPAPNAYHGQAQPRKLATLDDVVRALNETEVMLVDARGKAEYIEGHIPGAVNISNGKNGRQKAPKIWRPVEELKALYGEVGVTANAQVICYSQEGVRGSVTYFTLRLLGYDNVRLYSSSWDEWRRHPDLPTTSGDAP